MRRLNRFFLVAYSFILILVSLVLLFQLLSTAWAGDYANFIERISANGLQRALSIAAVAALLLSAILTLIYGLTSDRLHKARVSSTEVGQIDIGVEAIQNIALNSAKAAQAGVKSAKARVYRGKGGGVELLMAVQLYSDVEIPAQMAKIQDRVKKDVERYTGIPVISVKVKVKRVELVGAKVER